MSTYRYSASSPVDEVLFVHTEKGGIRAYVHASDKATPEQRRDIIRELRDEGWDTIPFFLEGKPLLEIRGLPTEKKLLNLLEIKKFTLGEAKYEKTQKDKTSLLETLKRRSLQVSGAFYMVGDYGFIRYGMKEASKLDIAGGILYLLGTLSLVSFGRNDQGDLQVEQHAKAMEHYLVKENVRIPSCCALHTLSEEKGKGMLGDAYDWMRSHPAELFNTIYVGAGACIAAAAVQHKLLKPVLNEMPKERMQRLAAGWMDVGLGTCTSTSALIANLVKEKKRDPDDPLPEGALNKVFAWIQEKPLRVAGYGYMVSTLCHAGSTTVEYMRARKGLDPVNDAKTMSAVPYRALFVGMNLVAELILALSSKGHGEGVISDESVKDTVYATGAELVMQQPPENRDWHINHLAGFLQQPDVLAVSFSEAEKELRHQVALMEKNPWLCVDKGNHVSKPGTEITHTPNIECPVCPAPSARNEIPSTTMQPATIAAQARAMAHPAQA